MIDIKLVLELQRNLEIVVEKSKVIVEIYAVDIEIVGIEELSR